MKNLSDFCVMIEGKEYLTVKQSYTLLEMSHANFFKQRNRYNYIVIDSRLYFPKDEVVEYNNIRLYNKAWKEKNKKEISNEE